MKKFVVTFLFSLITIIAFSDNVMDTYRMSHYGNRTWKIEASEPIDGKFNWYIQVAGNHPNDIVYIYLSSNEINYFIKKLQEIKKAYQYCSDTLAQHNNSARFSKISRYNQDINIDFRLTFFFNYNGKTYLTNATKLTITCMKQNFEDPMLVGVYSKIKPYNYKQCKWNKEAVMIFKNPREIDDLINLLDNNKVFEYYNKNKTSK